MNDEQKRMLVAVVLSATILFTWQNFFAPESTKVPAVPAKVEETTSSETNGSSNSNIVKSQTLPELNNVSSIEISNETGTFKIDNYLSISPIQSKYSDLSFEDIVGVKKPYILEFLVGDVYKSIEFSLEKKGDNSFSGASANGISVEGSIGEKGNLNLKFNSTSDIKYRFKFKTDAKTLDNGQIRKYAYFSDSLEVIDVGDEDKGEAKISWIGLDFNYHLFAFSFNSEKSFVFEAREDGALLAQTATSADKFDITVTFTKKDYDRLSTLGNHLSSSVDFGIWKIIAVPILRGLQFFYGIIANYGIAIILLTLVIRLITFPLQYKSFKSMKKMQTIQPELTKLKEKFKDDPQRMQKESMALFKRSGANPLGGCLPLILQMPVFFAFYKVLYSAVELVDAPFFLWIHDLSVKDPYYVLPVLMAIAMFFQQKLTPTATTDPTQKKVMMFMPLIFGLIMKDLPAGLCLYIFVSTLFGMIQQLIVYRSAD